MMMQAHTVFSVLFCTCILSVVSSCNNSGPGDCYFQSQDTCDWTPTSGWSVYRGYYYYYYDYYNNYYLELNVEHNTEETVESRTACSTNNAIHCLTFWYSFEEKHALNLSVIIQTSELGEQEVWRMSTSESWDMWYHARVPVNTTTEFTVIFKAWGSDSHRVAIDTIDYDKEVCDIQPADALPPHVATSSTPQPTSTTSAVETTTSTTDTTTTSSFSTETTVTRVFITSITSLNTGHQTDSAPTTVSQAGRADPAESSTDVGLIVGVVVAVVVLIVIGVVLCILFRRKQPQDWKTCFRTKKGKEEDFQVSAAHNAAYSLDDNDPHKFISVNMNPVRPERDMQQQGHCDSRLTSSPAETYYSVIRSPVEGTDFTTEEYININKANKVSNVEQGYQSSTESPYEISDSSESTAPHPSSKDDNYNQLNFHTRDADDHSDTCLPSPGQTDDYNYLASHHRETQLSADRDEEAGLYQNTATSSKAGDQQQTTALYQNVASTPDTQGHQQGPGSTHVHEQDPDRAMEDQSAAMDHLAKGTAQNPESFPNPGDAQEFSKNLDPTNGIYHVLEDQTPSEAYPGKSGASSNATAGDYQRLDFEGKGFAEERSDDVSLPTYSHLNEGEEGAYHGIDRNRRREVIDGDYSHV